MRFKGFVKAVSLLLTTSIVMGITGNARIVSAAGISLSGSCTVQRYGSIEGVWDDSSATLTLKGRTGGNEEYRQFEGITVDLNNSTGIEGSLKYSVFILSKGWQEFTPAGKEAGIKNMGLRIDAVKMELTGDLASKYTVEYAVQLQKNNNSQGFVSDGAVAGSTSDSRLIEEIKIRIVPANQGTSTSVNYRTHIESSGWGSKWSKDGEKSGAPGKGKKIDGIELNLTGNQYKGGITYRTNVQKSGWEKKWASNGEVSGIQGMRTESVAIKLTGEVAKHYDIYYRVYTPVYGWLGWAKNGEVSGTTDLANRLEGIQVILAAKGGSAPGDIGGIKSVIEIPEIKPTTPILPGSGLFKMGTDAKVSYTVKTSAGWSPIKSDGEVLEVSGAITGIAVGLNIPKHKLNLFADLPNFAGEYEDDIDGAYDISCSLNIVDTGARIESVRMYMTVGKYYDLATDYNLFYRVKTSGKGWMAWTNCSDESDEPGMCGTDEVGNSITAVQIVALPAGQTPAKDLNGVTSDCEKSFLNMADFPAPQLVTSNNKFAKWCLKTFPAKYKDPVNGLFSESKGWKYKYGGSSKKGCDCSGFVVYVMRKYFHKRVYHGMYKLSHKIGKNISYSKIRPGDWLCNWSDHHGWVSFYVGKDNYGHEVVLTGYVENGKVIPRLEYWNIKEWLSEPKHSLRRK